mgnify:CR=1 FL=1
MDNLETCGIRSSKINLASPTALASGTTILEGLNLYKTINLNDLEKGIVCEFKLDELKAPLSKKTIEYLKEQEIALDTIVKFELKEFKIIDEDN